MELTNAEGSCASSGEGRGLHYAAPSSGLDVGLSHLIPLIPKCVSGSIPGHRDLSVHGASLSQRGAGTAPHLLQACAFPWHKYLALHPANFTSTLEGNNETPPEKTLVKLEGMPALLLLSLWPTSCEKERVGRESDTQPTWRDRNKDRKAPRQRREAQAPERDIPQHGRDLQGAAESRGKGARETGERPAVTGWDAMR